jgi:hypothetical protein
MKITPIKEAWQKIVTRAWDEEEFKTRLLNETDKVLDEYHVKIPPGISYAAVEDGVQGKYYLVLPPKPEGDPSLQIDNFGRVAQSGDPGF